MAYLNKYSCSDCASTLWALSALQCGRCAGTMVMIQQATTPLPVGAYYHYDGGAVEFDWDNFNKWWDNAR